jgi:hypothetical protein
MANAKAINEPHVIHFKGNGNFNCPWREEKWGEKTLNAKAQGVYIDEKKIGWHCVDTIVSIFSDAACLLR